MSGTLERRESVTANDRGMRKPVSLIEFQESSILRQIPWPLRIERSLYPQRNL